MHFACAPSAQRKSLIRKAFSGLCTLCSSSRAMRGNPSAHNKNKGSSVLFIRICYMYKRKYLLEGDLFKVHKCTPLVVHFSVHKLHKPKNSSEIRYLPKCTSAQAKCTSAQVLHSPHIGAPADPPGTKNGALGPVS